MLFLLANKKKKPALQIISGFLLFQCVVVAGIAFYLYYSANGLQGKSLHAQGTVTALLQSSDTAGGHSTAYYPEVTFKDSSGKVATFRSPLPNNPPEYVKGDKVPVLYDAGNPSSARINQFSTLWLVSLACFIVSAIALIASVGFGIWSRFTPQ